MAFSRVSFAESVTRYSEGTLRGPVDPLVARQGQRADQEATQDHDGRLRELLSADEYREDHLVYWRSIGRLFPQHDCPEHLVAKRCLVEFS